MSYRAKLDNLLAYSTVKIVQIKQWELGMIHYLIQLGIVAYVIVWVIILNKGYQSSNPLIGTSNVKIKGSAYYMNGSNVIPWDSYDVVYPPKEENAFFVATNFHATYGQSRGICSDPTLPCTADHDCLNLTSTANGVPNGTCNIATNSCELYAWCPLEKSNPQYQLIDVNQFTVFMKVNVYFPQYKILRDNIGDNMTTGLNYWTIQQMYDAANVTYNESVHVNGSLILISCHWSCDFDHDPQDCLPTFTFTRIDQSSSLSVGYNFRYTNYYWLPDENNTELLSGRTFYRDLIKLYGTRFVVLTSGTGAKFNIIPLMINFASGLALLSIATIVSDVIACYILPRRKFYSGVKYQEVEDPITESSPLINQDDKAKK